MFKRKYIGTCNAWLVLPFVKNEKKVQFIICFHLNILVLFLMLFLANLNF